MDKWKCSKFEWNMLRNFRWRIWIRKGTYVSSIVCRVLICFLYFCQLSSLEINLSSRKYVRFEWCFSSRNMVFWVLILLSKGVSKNPVSLVSKLSYGCYGSRLVCVFSFYILLIIWQYWYIFVIRKIKSIEIMIQESTESKCFNILYTIVYYFHFHNNKICITNSKRQI